MSIGVNKSGTDWQKIKAWLEGRIAAIHAEMEYPQTPEAYNALRGSIAMARNLIDQVEPSTPPRVEEDNYGISEG